MAHRRPSRRCFQTSGSRWTKLGRSHNLDGVGGTQRRQLIVITAVLGLLAAPPSASAALDVELLDQENDDQTEAWTDFTARDSDCGANFQPDGTYTSATCRARFRVRRGDRVLLDTVREFDNSARYRWSCKRTGLHSWSARAMYTNDTTGDKSTVFRSGVFRVPRCTRWRNWRVSRGRAAREAASFYPDEYVSRSRCRALSRKRHGRASRWLCSVIHNDSIRACRRRIILRFEKRRWFGEFEWDYHYKLGGRKCIYF